MNLQTDQGSLNSGSFTDWGTPTPPPSILFETPNEAKPVQDMESWFHGIVIRPVRYAPLTEEPTPATMTPVMNTAPTIERHGLTMTSEAANFIRENGLSETVVQARDVLDATFKNIRSYELRVVEGDFEGEDYLQFKIEVDMDSDSAVEAYHAFYERLHEVLPLEKSILFSVDYLRV